jgi:hypothetical protein
MMISNIEVGIAGLFPGRGGGMEGGTHQLALQSQLQYNLQKMSDRAEYASLQCASANTLNRITNYSPANGP